jgi:leucyl-tRNA synthetase
MKYNFKKIEPKWQAKWEEAQLKADETFRTPKNPYYCCLYS